ncbi:MAG: glycosyl hydrolase 115 family protein, partial [Flavobacteriales bacterium]|nr:glycosyl hydrolase 115 family protein [Flavobacteriales bacterium]
YAIDDFNEDCKDICGYELPIIHELKNGKGNIIIPIITESFDAYGLTELKDKIDLEKLKDKRESYIIQKMDSELDNIDNVLIIAGSDPLGAVYGLYDVSEQAFGTDPQKFWTDASPRKIENASWVSGTKFQAPPTFKYRGFFINDENFLMSWKGAEDDIEDEVLEEIFEYVLRMRGNFFAESEYALPFGPKIKKYASDRGLYYTASHLQILMSFPKFEWDVFSQEHYGKKLDYLIYKSPEHEEAISAYWEECVKRQIPNKTIWPIGFRYSDDRDFVDVDPDAPKTAKERGVLTSKAIEIQEEILDKYLKEEPITSYSMRGDLLHQYLAGSIKLPKEGIVVWNDEGSFNVFPALPKPKDLEVNPNHGVYYHLSYCDNQWVQYVPIKKIQDEFIKVLDAGANSLVMYNVGDIREIPLTIAAGMDLAYDAKPWLEDADYHSKFVKNWSQKQYGKEAGDEIGELLAKYWKMEGECRANSIIETVTVPLLFIYPRDNIHEDLRGMINKPIFETFKENSDNPEFIANYAAAFKLREGGRYGKANLEHLQSTEKEWGELVQQTIKLKDKVDSDRKSFYFDSVELHILSSR